MSTSADVLFEFVNQRILSVYVYYGLKLIPILVFIFSLESLLLDFEPNASCNGTIT